VTLIELMVTLSLFGILSVMAVAGWRSYTNSSSELGSAKQAVTTLRSVAQRAIAEDTSYCLRFSTSAGTATLWRTACGTGTSLGTVLTAPSSCQFTAASFTQTSGGTAADLYFYPRGAATPGNVTIARTGSSKTYTVTVQALTGHVSYA
jgi:prepilin-type N-terminal cleavage/methylation domain-containing protein